MAVVPKVLRPTLTAMRQRNFNDMKKNKIVKFICAIADVIGSICFHNWKTINIHYEVPSANYGNVYFDIYTKKCKRCEKNKRVLVPYTATKCKVSINSKIMMDGIENKYYL